MQDQVTPKGKWEFDAEVAGCFDDMLSRSIPQYDVMRKTCLDLAVRYVKDGTTVVDLGCSSGGSLSHIVDAYGLRARYLGLEVSEPMIAEAKKRFGPLADSGVVSIRNWDLRKGLPPVRASVVLSILTLQFTPIEYRLKILKSVFDSLSPGGAFLLVEKVIGASAELDDAMVATYYGMKAANGYSQEQIDRKRLSLEGVLVPVTAQWNREMLTSCGFREVDCFWRWMNFAGWIAIKPA